MKKPSAVIGAEGFAGLEFLQHPGRRCDPPNAGENGFNGKLVHFGLSTSHSIFNEQNLVIPLPGIAGGGFNAEVGGNPAQDNRFDSASAQLQFEVSTVKGAPVVFQNNDIGRVGI